MMDSDWLIAFQNAHGVARQNQKGSLLNFLKNSMPKKEQGSSLSVQICILSNINIFPSIQRLQYMC
jgi:hypothetical protein